MNYETVEYVAKGYWYGITHHDDGYTWTILHNKGQAIVGYYYHLTLYKSSRSAVRAAIKWVHDND